MWSEKGNQVKGKGRHNLLQSKGGGKLKFNKGGRKGGLRGLKGQ